jgi:hypothetical protein
MKKIEIAIWLVIALAIVGVIGFILAHKDLDARLGTEVFKLTYEFLLIVVIGGAISLLYSQFTKSQEKRDKEKALQAKFRVGFLQSYNAAKSVRRLLRATARTLSEVKGTTTEVVKLAPYDRLMQKLVHVQLQFETLREEAAAEKKLFEGVPELKDLDANLGTIESYLNDIVGEYEHSYKLFHKGDLQPISDFEKLAEFIGPYKNAVEFKARCKKPANYILEGILQLMMKAS